MADDIYYWSKADAQKVINVVKPIYYGAEDRTGEPYPGEAAYTWFWGKIVDKGPSNEADYTDSRYWFKRVNLTTSGDTITDKNQWTEIPDAEKIKLHGTLENILESADGTHNLNKDAIVKIFWATPKAGKKHRYFTAAGGAAKLPEGQYQGQFFGMPSQNQAAWTFVFAHEMPT